MAVGGIFFGPAITPRDQSSGDRCDCAAARKQLIEKNDAEVQPRAQNLQLSDMSQILMGNLMSHYSKQLFITGFFQQACRYIELAATGIGCIDLWIINDADINFFGSSRII